MKKTASVFFSVLFLLTLFGFGIWTAVRSPDAISQSERRELAQKPTFSAESIWDGSAFESAETYLLDQFPGRDLFRRVKAFSRFCLLGQKENHGIVFADGQAASLSDALTEKSVEVYLKRLNTLYNEYLLPSDCKVYTALIPDKMAYFSDAYPKIDYAALRETLAAGSPGQYIEIGDTLSLQSYFSTDTHWRQDAIVPTANRILGTMGAALCSETEVLTALSPFWGVYYGQSALPLPPDRILCMTNAEIAHAAVRRADLRTGELTDARMYYEENIGADDAYDVFLGGACTVIEIDNTLVSEGKTLYLFSDSFGRSLAPLLLSDYDRVVVYDIRYIRTSRALEKIPIDRGSDVLIAYSISAIDVSDNLRVD